MIGSSTRISGADHEFLCDSGDRLYEIVRAEEETSGPLRVATPTARSAGLFPIRLSSYLCHTFAYEAPSVKTLPSSQYQTVSVTQVRLDSAAVNAPANTLFSTAPIGPFKGHGRRP
jgi:hypothetical protein